MLPDPLHRLEITAKSAVALAAGAALLLSTFIVELTPALPNGWQDNFVQIGGTIVAGLLAVAQAVRRLTPVPPSLRGILPPSDTTR